MRVEWGANNMGWFGAYAYTYMEIGGDEIEDGAVVSTYFSVYNTDYYDTAINQTVFHNGEIETVECRVNYWGYHDSQDEYRGYAEEADINVRTYVGKADNPRREVFVWSKPAVLLNQYYKQTHTSNGWDD